MAEQAATAKSQDDGKKWYQSKTVWTGVVGALTAVGAAVTGEMSTGQAIQTGVTSLIGIFLRLGMLK